MILTKFSSCKPNSLNAITTAMNFFSSNNADAKGVNDSAAQLSETQNEEKHPVNSSACVCNPTDVSKAEFVGATRVRRNFVTRKYNWTVDYEDLCALHSGTSTQFPFVVLNDGTRLDVEMRTHYETNNLWTTSLNKGILNVGFRVKVDKREEAPTVEITGSTVRLYVSNPDGVIIWANSYYNVPLSGILNGCSQTIGPLDWENEIPNGCTVRLVIDAHYVESEFESLGEVESSE